MPDILVMTATPIPRTLAMTLFGDLDISTIITMPPGRQPISTHLARLGREEKVYDWVRAEIEAGRQAYFVYPLVSESSKMALKDARGDVRATQTALPRIQTRTDPFPAGGGA